jgi:hypothetical protein
MRIIILIITIIINQAFFTSCPYSLVANYIDSTRSNYKWRQKQNPKTSVNGTLKLDYLPPKLRSKARTWKIHNHHRHYIKSLYGCFSNNHKAR